MLTVQGIMGRLSRGHSENIALLKGSRYLWMNLEKNRNVLCRNKLFFSVGEEISLLCRTKDKSASEAFAKQFIDFLGCKMLCKIATQLL